MELSTNSCRTDFKTTNKKLLWLEKVGSGKEFTANINQSFQSKKSNVNGFGLAQLKLLGIPNYPQLKMSNDNRTSSSSFSYWMAMLFRGTIKTRQYVTPQTELFEDCEFRNTFSCWFYGFWKGISKGSGRQKGSILRLNLLNQELETSGLSVA